MKHALFCLLATLFIAAPAVAEQDWSMYYPMNNCPKATTDQQFRACVDSNTDKLKQSAAHPAISTPQVAQHFFHALDALKPGYVDPEAPENMHDNSLRSQIAEWVWSATPDDAFTLNGPLPTSYDLAPPSCLEYWPMPGGDKLVIACKALAASNGVKGAFKLTAAGAITQMQMENLDYAKMGKGKKNTVKIGPAIFNDEYYESKTDRWSDTNNDGDSLNSSEYQLQGELFRLISVEELSKTTDKKHVLYRGPHA